MSFKIASKKFTPKAALEKAKHYCAYQERCHSEVKNKLYTWGLYSSDVNNIIVTLIEENFLNEQRFAESFVSGKFRIKHWGKIKIEQQLKGKQISDRCIKEAIQTIDEQEYEDTCLLLAEKKMGLLEDISNSWDRDVKIYRYLMSKGYDSSLIKKILLQIKNV
jgi:regulatory protein